MQFVMFSHSFSTLNRLVLFLTPSFISSNWKLWDEKSVLVVLALQC
jgi:hypothetical protein